MTRSRTWSEALGGRPVVRNHQFAVAVVALGHRLRGVAELILGRIGVVDLIDLGRHGPAEGMRCDALQNREAGVVVEQADGVASARGCRGIGLLRPAPPDP